MDKKSDKIPERGRHSIAIKAIRGCADLYRCVLFGGKCVEIGKYFLLVGLTECISIASILPKLLWFELDSSIFINKSTKTVTYTQRNPSKLCRYGFKTWKRDGLVGGFLHFRTAHPYHAPGKVSPFPPIRFSPIWMRSLNSKIKM